MVNTIELNKEMASSVSRALRSLHPSCVYTIRGDDIEWHSDDIDEPSPEEIQAERDKLASEYDALQYQRDRKPEYPSIADQLDYIYHNGIAKWKSDMVKPVKDAHPKP